MTDTVIIGRGVLRLLADSAGLRREVDRAIRAAGAGQDINVRVRADGSRLWRDVNGYLRDERGRFARAGEGLGDSISDGMRRSFNRSARGMLGNFDFLPIPGQMLAIAAAAIPAAVAVLGLVSSLGLASTSLAAVGPLALGAAAMFGAVMLAFKSLETVTTKAGSAFKAELETWKSSIKTLQRTAQKNVLPGVTAFLASARTLMPIINDHIGKMGYMFGAAARSAGGLMETPLFQGRLAQMLRNNEGAFSLFTQSITPALNAMMGLGASVSGLGVRFGQAWLNGVLALSNIIELKTQSGELAAFFNRAGDEMGVWWRTARDLIAGVVNILRAALPSGQKMARGLEQIAASFRKWTGSAEGQEKIRGFFEFFINIDYQRIFQIASAITAVGLAMKGLNLIQGTAGLVMWVASLGPVGLAILAVVVAIGALAAAFGWMYSSSASFRKETADMITAVRDNLGPGFSRVADLLTNRVGPAIAGVVVPRLRELGGYIKNTLLPALGEMYNNYVPKLEKAWTTVSNAFRDNKQQLTEAWNVFKTVISWLTANVLPVLGTIAGFMVGVLAGAISFVVNTVGFFIKVWEFLIAAVKSAGDAIGSFISGVIGFFTALPGQIMAAIQAFPGMLLGLITGGLNLVLGAIGFWIGAVIGFMIALPINILSALISLPGLIAGIWNSVFSWTVSIVSSIVSSVASFFSSIPGWVSSGLSTIGGVVSSAFQSAVNAVGSGISTIGGKLSSIPGMAANALGNLGGVLWDAGASLIRGLVSGIESQIGNLRSKLGEITSMIPDLKGPEDKDRVLLYPAGRAIIEGLVRGIQYESKDLRGELTRLTSDIGATPPAALATTGSGLTQQSAAGGATYVFQPGAIVLDASKISSIEQLVQLVGGLKTTARKYGAETTAGV